MPYASRLIGDARRRQVVEGGFDAAHDDALPEGELSARAMAMLAAYEFGRLFDVVDAEDREEILVEAGALVAAEIDRLRRVEGKVPGFGAVTDDDEPEDEPDPLDELDAAVSDAFSAFAARQVGSFGDRVGWSGRD